MNKTIGAALDQLLQKVKFRPGRTGSPLSYNVMNPLANIRMAIEMVEAKNKDEDVKLYIDIIKRNCESISVLINEVPLTERPFILQDKNQGISSTKANVEY